MELFSYKIPFLAVCIIVLRAKNQADVFCIEFAESSVIFATILDE